MNGETSTSPARNGRAFWFTLLVALAAVASGIALGRAGHDLLAAPLGVMGALGTYATLELYGERGIRAARAGYSAISAVLVAALAIGVLTIAWRLLVAIARLVLALDGAGGS